MRIICHGLTDEDFPVEFHDHEISLGSAESDSIVMKAAGISGRHALLLEDGKELFIRDNGSPGGTFLNHNRVQDRRKVSSGDIIQLGDWQIRVVFSSSETVKLFFVSSVAESDVFTTAVTMMQASPPAGDKPAASVCAESNDPFVTMKTVAVPQPPSAGSGPDRPADPVDPVDPVESESSGTPTPIMSRTQRIILEKGAIGKYAVKKMIGKGGMGEVYLAMHKTLGYRVIKILPKELLETNKEFLDRFIREAKLAAEISHPNVVGVMDVETDSVIGPYIVMEYVDGGSLKDILKSSKTHSLSEEQAIVVVESIASALKAAKEKEIVHRDIKPDNIMFTKQGVVKLADLGIAKKDSDPGMTETNMMMGTPAYLPPEQARNAKGVDARADIYSLGATFYEMLTGRLPYPGGNPVEILNKLLSAPVPDPRKINPGISPASAAIVMKMLAKKPKDRFQSAAELLETMERTFPRHTANESAELIKKAIAGNRENTPDFDPGTKSPWRFQRGYRWAAAAVLLAGIFILGSFLLFRGGQENPPAQSDIGTIPSSGVTVDPVPEPVKRYELRIRTVPDSDIQLIFPGGRKEVYSSGQDGELKMPNLETGRYEIRIERKNYHPVSEVVELDGDKDLDMRMAPDLKKLVIKAQPGSEIRISGKENREKTMKASADGVAEFTDLLPEEMVYVHVELQGWEPYEKSFVLIRDQEVQVAQKRIVTTLTVRTARSAKIVLKQNGKEVQTKNANSDGEVKFDNIIPGEYSLEISGEGYHTREMVCDLNRNQNLDVELQRITYELRIDSDPGAMIALFLNNQSLNKEYRVPSSGSLILPDMQPGLYNIDAKKEGMRGNSFSVTLDRDLSVDCHLEAIAVEPDPGPVAGPVAGTVMGAGQDSDSGQTPPAKREGTISFYLQTIQSELGKYILERGLEISVGDRTWSDIRENPWRLTLDAGKYNITVRCDGIEDMNFRQFTVDADKENGCLLKPVSLPTFLRFVSNRDDAVITFENTSRSPGEIVACEPFQEYALTGTHNGDRSISRTVCNRTPGKTLTVEFDFVEMEKTPVQLQYEEGLALLEEKEFKKALDTLLPAAEAGHKDAILKVAEIYESGEGLGYDLGFLGTTRSSDAKEAWKWYRKAAELGDPEAARKAAEAIRDRSVAGTAKEMLDLYLKASSLNEADVFYRISNLYRDGAVDIPKDDAKAVDYLRKAADLGWADAMYDLGVRYEKGNGIPADSEKAMSWFEKAAAAGHAEAGRRIRNVRNP